MPQQEKTICALLGPWTLDVPQRLVHRRYMQPSRVLLPLRGEGDERALWLAADIADRFDVSMELFAAAEDSHEAAAHQHYLDEVRHRVHKRHSHLRIATEVVVDAHAPDAIAGRVDSLTLAVMATSTRPFLHDGYVGSAAEHVIRRTQRPVVLAGPSFDSNAGLSARRVIVPLDGSTLSESALGVANVWAQRLGVPLWVMSVVSPDGCPPSPSGAPANGATESLRRVAAREGAPWEVLHAADAAEALASAAGTDSLIIMSTHGRSGIRRLALGSVAVDLTRHANCPVMVIAPD
jgi:nucleotide-binding universal stress UspA family protein